jgi:predicted aldo/keto reductase-like oxidoreductase
MGPKALKEMTVSIIEKAKGCTECGECESRCPYELPIPELIKSAIKCAGNEIAKN